MVFCLDEMQGTMKSFPLFTMASIPFSEWMPRSDVATMELRYEHHPKKLPNLTPSDFVDKICYRIYTEFCCNGEESPKWEDHFRYDGRAYRKWVADETHYVTEGQTLDHSQYANIRESILRAVVERAIELFTDWKGYSGPSDETDRRNLRASLKPYLSRLEQTV